jgi:hypothetical protein
MTDDGLSDLSDLTFFTNIHKIKGRLVVGQWQLKMNSCQLPVTNLRQHDKNKKESKK